MTTPESIWLQQNYSLRGTLEKKGNMISQAQWAVFIFLIFYRGFQIKLFFYKHNRIFNRLALSSIMEV